MEMSMDERFDRVYELLKLEFKKQTEELTCRISFKLEEKLKPLRQENKKLSSEIENLEKKIEYLERDSKKNNIIIFGLEEKETCVRDLLEAVRRKLVDDLKMSVLNTHINNVFRVGKRKNSEKPRPVVVTFVHKWQRNEVLRNKTRFRSVFVTEDYPKNVVEKRKLWLEELKEERKKGNIAYLVYDKLLVKPGITKEGIKKKEEEERNVDLSETLNGNEQREKEEENKPKQRRAKAMINRNKSLFDDDNDKFKPRKGATAMINKKNNSSDEEFAGEKVFRRAFENFTRKTDVSNPNEDSEKDVEKPKTGAIKKTYKKDEYYKKEYGQDKDKPQIGAGKNDLFSEYVQHKRKMDY